MTIEEMISDAAQRYRIDPDLLRKLVHQESGGKPDAVSSKGARGVMQLMPDTAKAMGVNDVNDPQQNIEGGTKYLAQLIDRYNGDVRKALAAYNAGPEKVDQYGGVPPYPETENYVKNILGDTDTKTKKGVRTFTAEGPDGQKVRIQVPSGSDTSPEALRPLFQAEFNRRQSFGKDAKDAVKPLNRSLAERFGTGLYEGYKGNFQGEHELTPDQQKYIEAEEGNMPYWKMMTSLPPANDKQSASVMDFVPFGSTIRDVFSGRAPEAVGRLLGSAPAVPTSGTGPVGNLARRTTAGIQEGMTEPGFSRGAGSLGASAGGVAGAKTATTLGMPPYVGYIPGGALGGALGGKVPSFARGFARGFSRSPQFPAEAEVFDAQPTGNPYQDIPRQWAGRQLPNTADARTQPPATPMASATTPYDRSAGALPGASQQLPAASSIQMGPAHEVPVYGNQQVVRSPYTGTYMKRQMPLDLHQEGANIPGGGYQGPPPPRESGVEGGATTDQDIQSLGKPYQPPLQMTRSGKATPEELQYLGQKLALTPEELLKKYPHLGEGEETFTYKGKEGAKTEDKPKSEVTQVILPSAVRDYAKVHGISDVEAAKYFRDQGYEIRRDPFLRKGGKKTDQVIDLK